MESAPIVRSRVQPRIAPAPGTAANHPSHSSPSAGDTTGPAVHRARPQREKHPVSPASELSAGARRLPRPRGTTSHQGSVSTPVRRGSHSRRGVPPTSVTGEAVHFPTPRLRWHQHQAHGQITENRGVVGLPSAIPSPRTLTLRHRDQPTGYLPLHHPRSPNSRLSQHPSNLAYPFPPSTPLPYSTRGSGCTRQGDTAEG